MIRKAKRTLSLVSLLVAMLLLALACNSKLDIHQAYLFDLVTMPVPKRIVQGETIEIRCQIVKEGDYTGTRFSIRYFQTDGKGELRLDDGRVLTPNDLYLLTNDVFRLLTCLYLLISFLH